MASSSTGMHRPSPDRIGQRRHEWRSRDEPALRVSVCSSQTGVISSYTKCRYTCALQLPYVCNLSCFLQCSYTVFPKPYCCRPRLLSQVFKTLLSSLTLRCNQVSFRVWKNE